MVQKMVVVVVVEVMMVMVRVMFMVNASACNSRSWTCSVVQVPTVMLPFAVSMSINVVVSIYITPFFYFIFLLSYSSFVLLASVRYQSKRDETITRLQGDSFYRFRSSVGRSIANGRWADRCCSWPCPATHPRCNKS